MLIYKTIDERIHDFLTRHPTIKAVWRAALIVTLAAIAQELGLGNLIDDIASEF
jgi:ABC-type sugar transport system substrate-binding protein